GRRPSRLASLAPQGDGTEPPGAAQVTEIAPRRFDIPAALKDAVLSAIVAFGLFSLLIGFRTDQGPPGALIVWPRLEALAWTIAVVFAGAFVRALIFRDGTIE